jgi:predicted Rossmann fold nucleotide-binding protein DprA/Smf involved in DNA uptake
VDNEEHLKRIVALLSKGPATVTVLASSVGLAEDEVLRLLAKLRADDRVIKFADSDDWFLVIERAGEGPRAAAA